MVLISNQAKSIPHKLPAAELYRCIEDFCLGADGDWRTIYPTTVEYLLAGQVWWLQNSL